MPGSISSEKPLALRDVSSSEHVPGGDQRSGGRVSARHHPGARHVDGGLLGGCERVPHQQLAVLHSAHPNC